MWPDFRNGAKKTDSARCICVLWHCGHSLFSAGNASTISAVVAFAIDAATATIVVIYSCRNFSFH